MAAATLKSLKMPNAIMYLLKLICLTVVQWVKQACLLPQSLVAGIRQWRRQAALNETEAERLDRIRRPSRYLGK